MSLGVIIKQYFLLFFLAEREYFYKVFTSQYQNVKLFSSFHLSNWTIFCKLITFSFLPKWANQKFSAKCWHDNISYHVISSFLCIVLTCSLLLKWAIEKFSANYDNHKFFIRFRQCNIFLQNVHLFTAFHLSNIEQFSGKFWIEETCMIFEHFAKIVKLLSWNEGNMLIFCRTMVN